MFISGLGTPDCAVSSKVGFGIIIAAAGDARVRVIEKRTGDGAKADVLAVSLIRVGAFGREHHHAYRSES